MELAGWLYRWQSGLLQEQQLRSPDEIRGKYARYPRISSGYRLLLWEGL